MNAPQRFELQQTRFIRAPREKVFDAFTNEAMLRQWHCPRGLSVPHSRCDARAGGQWQLNMLSRDGSSFAVGGVYREVSRPERLVYTWAWQGDNSPMGGVETLVEVDFLEREGGTELRLRHSGFPAAAARDAHAAGWRSTLNRLVDTVDAHGSAATLTLLGDVRSTYTRTARMALAEKGLAYTLQPCAPHSPELLALNPFGRIPALRDGEIELFETSAIVRYLDESFGSAATLLPGTPLARAQCEQWVSAVNAYLYDTMVRRYVLQYIFPRGEGGQPDRAVIDAALKEMPAQLAALDTAYGVGDWLAGGALSMADLWVAPILAYVERFPEGAQMMAAAPNVRRAQATLRARASFIDTDPGLSAKPTAKE
ncbi:MAG TPA: SRPBCC domain-containing protein [Rubrivivax sp.]|nr:SRPBCC domain-containing protein [Rubrivivax sp.]